MGAQDQSGAQAVAIIVKLLIMMAAETGSIRLGTNIVFHIRSATSQNEINRMFLNLTFQKTERTFVFGTKSIHQRDGINRLFHSRISLYLSHINQYRRVLKLLQ